MGKGGSLSEGIIKKIILSYTYVAIWIFLSSTVIVIQQIHPRQEDVQLAMPNFLNHDPHGFLFIHRFPPYSFFTNLLLSQLGHCFLSASGSPIPPITLSPAYIYLSVPFIQMLKAMMPVAVYSIRVLLKKDQQF
ncbi:hypothetical protein RJ641_025240 [Dillenia turbinata]|uniref:Uncharacterized protein n=1 Tax=Dillenia turbinata TaxID=194707 RepID=A0AAN8W0H2_9MAGN